MNLIINKSSYAKGTMVQLQDSLDGHYKQIGKIIKVKDFPKFSEDTVEKEGPFSIHFPNILLDVKFDDGYVLPDVFPSELKLV